MFYRNNIVVLCNNDSVMQLCIQAITAMNFEEKNTTKGSDFVNAFLFVLVLPALIFVYTHSLMILKMGSGLGVLHSARFGLQIKGWDGDSCPSNENSEHIACIRASKCRSCSAATSALLELRI